MIWTQLTHNLVKTTQSIHPYTHFTHFPTIKLIMRELHIPITYPDAWDQSYTHSQY